MATRVARVCRTCPLWPAYAGLSDDIMLPKVKWEKSMASTSPNVNSRRSNLRNVVREMSGPDRAEP